MTSDRHVAETLKALDRDAYYSSLFVSAKSRDAVQTLWAFGADVAAVAARVSEPMPGEIRLQWWVDALEGRARGEVSQNPLANALLAVLSMFELAAGPLVRLVAARRFDLYHDPMPDMATFEGYAGETGSILFQYAATVLGDGTAPEDGDAAGHLGVALALYGHLIAFGYHAARGRIYLPMDVFSKSEIAERQILAGRSTPELTLALEEMVSAADGHADKAREAVRAMPPRFRPAFARAALLPAMRKTALAVSADPFKAPRLPGELGKLWSLMAWAARATRA